MAQRRSTGAGAEFFVFGFIRVGETRFDLRRFGVFPMHSRPQWRLRCAMKPRWAWRSTELIGGGLKSLDPQLLVLIFVDGETTAGAMATLRWVDDVRQVDRW